VPPVPAPPAALDRLERQLAGQPAPLVSLVKSAGVSLAKRGLASHRARVALCLDISGSMSVLFGSGAVQQLIERVLALAIQLDDDGQADVFTFGTDAHEEAPVELASCTGYTQALLSARPLEMGTDYAKAMRAVRAHYFPDGAGGARDTPRPDRLPVYVIFVTDGATSNRSAAVAQVRWSSYEPIFWQFIAIGTSSRNVLANGAPPRKKRRRHGLMARLVESGFAFLEELDDLDGRLIDNANFFSVADPSHIPDEQLYELLMTEYPGWLQLARGQGLLPPA
jgi:hypothetical protein